ncbi:hypothetical protein IHE44_0007954 [Lamprotornis superbus]|uniref:protein kinase C n=1 Tax=Lamprotornis superbus TaxID=245042 RepID=A0A835NPU1_9PASS|nr:hypothetical protein IHE44_0007954 [Lamprotornis superbus]
MKRIDPGTDNVLCGLQRAYCGQCSERIWGLSKQGYKCINCKLLVHKRCHILVPLTCKRHMDSVMPSQEPRLDDKNDEADLPSEDTDGKDLTQSLHINNVIHLEQSEKSEYASILKGLKTFKNASGMDLKPVIDGMDGIKISQGLGLQDFDLIRVIGRGSYAKVLLVRLKKNDQIYAMKVVKKELVHDDEDIDWVQTEKHVFEQASSNPFLVGLHSCFQTTSRSICNYKKSRSLNQEWKLFLVIEYVNGGDLMFHMQRQRKLPEEHARFYAAEICIALNFLHERGIIYRDLKLDNVLLDAEGHIKLTDYGMCKEGLGPGDTTSTFCGTPNYIAPEILRGEEYGFSVDWWALGVLMFEMMAGRSPFDIITDNPDMNTEDYLFQVILEKPIRIPRFLSVKASHVLKGFLNKDPKERLGCQPQTGFADIKSHTFFRSIDWDLFFEREENKLEKKQTTPPFQPQITDDYGLDNFDTQFTSEPVQLTPDDEYYMHARLGTGHWMETNDLKTNLLLKIKEENNDFESFILGLVPLLSTLLDLPHDIICTFRQAPGKVAIDVQLGESANTGTVTSFYCLFFTPSQKCSGMKLHGEEIRNNMA